MKSKCELKFAIWYLEIFKEYVKLDKLKINVSVTI